MIIGTSKRKLLEKRKKGVLKVFKYKTFLNKSSIVDDKSIFGKQNLLLWHNKRLVDTMRSGS